MMNPTTVLDPKLEEILDEAQKKRLGEMFLWVNGGFALIDKGIAATLDLTDEQKASVKEIDSERRKAVMEGMTSGPSGLKGLKKKMEECGAKMLAVLTPDQAKKLEELKGKEFKFRK
jgi:Spy/CpxP family protein refolding chaperone